MNVCMLGCKSCCCHTFLLIISVFFILFSSVDWKVIQFGFFLLLVPNKLSMSWLASTTNKRKAERKKIVFNIKHTAGKQIRPYTLFRRRCYRV